MNYSASAASWRRFAAASCCAISCAGPRWPVAWCCSCCCCWRWRPPRLGPAGFWLPLIVFLAILCLTATTFAGVWRPARLLRTDRTARRLVARLQTAAGGPGRRHHLCHGTGGRPHRARRRTSGIAGGDLCQHGSCLPGAGRRVAAAPGSGPADLDATRAAWRSGSAGGRCGVDGRRVGRSGRGGTRPVDALSPPQPVRRRGGVRSSRWSATCASPTTTRRTPGWRRAPSRDRPATSSRSRGRACGSRRHRCAPRARRCCCWARHGEKRRAACRA